ncbi:MAG: peptide chain release factor N(5)-glutamine methyltransferase [Pseudomonadota bacterium]|nr:peptide chain release factor N(5)-glutamine methyltransferase [Pseudomonadota bacterium]
MARIDATLRQARALTAPEDAEALLAHALGRPRSWLYAHGDDDLEEDAAARFHALVQRRASGEPVAYLTGRRGFWSLDLQVTPATLIPRPETELLVEIALARLPGDRPLRVADLGTGSGAIALALAHERRNARVLATDVSAAALEVARANASRLGLANVEFRHGDWLVPLAGERIDLIGSNPPYIAETDEHLRQGDLRFEPAAALASGDDGLDAIRRIASGAGACLVPGGWLLIEHGWQQGAPVRALLQQAGLVEIATQRDLSLHERVSFGRAPIGRISAADRSACVSTRPQCASR